MSNKIQVLRSATAGARPANLTRSIGEIYLNFADLQLGFIDGAQEAQDLLAVTFHSDTASYITGNVVVYNGILYIANVDIATPEVFNISKWDVVGGMENPMTTEGDIIYGANTGTPTRLAGGSEGQVLTMNIGATAPEWTNIQATPEETITFKKDGAVNIWQNPYFGFEFSTRLAPNIVKGSSTFNGGHVSFGYSKTRTTASSTVTANVLVYNVTVDGELTSGITDTSLPSSASWKVLTTVDEVFPLNLGASKYYDGFPIPSHTTKISDLDAGWSDTDEIYVIIQLDFNGDNWSSAPEDIIIKHKIAIAY